jgi:hypothetical protein
MDSREQSPSYRPGTDDTFRPPASSGHSAFAWERVEKRGWEEGERLTLEVGDEVLGDVLPCLEALNEDVRGAQVGGACWSAFVRSASFPRPKEAEREAAATHPMHA